LKAFKVILVLVTALCLGGCYDNPLTIGSSRGIDERLLGSWQYHEKNEKVGYTSFMRRGGEEYFVRTSEAGKKPSYFRAYFSTIDGVDILNVQEMGNSIKVGKGKYYFFTYQIIPQGKLILSTIDLDSRQSAPSLVLRREISEKLAEGKLKLEPQTFTRVR